jgi:hypothetical protein
MPAVLHACGIRCAGMYGGAHRSTPCFLLVILRARPTLSGPAPPALVQAREDLSIAAQLQSSMAEECQRELRRLAAREVQAAQKQKQEFRNFFDR